MSTVPAFASASEAMDMVHAGLGYLAATDATAMAADTQARCLQMLEQATAMGTAARASILARSPPPRDTRRTRTTARRRG